MTHATQSPQVDTILRHIHALAVDIGPRGSTTPGEKLGADYCQKVLQNLGLSPVCDSFTSARSIFQPHLVATLFYLASFLIYPLGGYPPVYGVILVHGATALFAALLVILTLASELFELGFSDNMLRQLVSKGKSQNVSVVIPPSGEHRQDLVLIGHIDTQRTPLIFRTPRWVEAYKAFTTVAFVLFTWQGIIFLVGAITRWSWAWYAAIPSALCALLLLGICIEADRTPFTAGANDNASSVGMVLTLAEELSKNPLNHTRIYAVCTGCEEVQHYGTIDFFRRNRAQMRSPRALVFELLGCAGPGWLTSEGIIVPFHSDPVLRKQVEDLSSSHPEWGAYPVKITGGNSEMADCLRASVPAITIFGLTRTGEAPYWHTLADTFDKIDPQVLTKTYVLTHALIQSIDADC